MHAYERWMILRYLCALLKSKRFERSPDTNADIFAWIEAHGRRLGLPRLVQHSAGGNSKAA